MADDDDFELPELPVIDKGPRLSAPCVATRWGSSMATGAVWIATVN